MRTTRSTGVLRPFLSPSGALVAAIGVWCLLGSPLPVGRLLAQDKGQQFITAMRAADRAYAAHQFDAAVDAYKKANSAMGNASLDALFGLARAYEAEADFKQALAATAQALKVAGDDVNAGARFHNERGLILIGWAGEGADPARMKQAEDEFHIVLTATDTMPIASFNLGVALLKEHRDDEGIEQLKAFVDRVGRGPDVDRAKGMIADPRRARENFAPDFSLDTLEGDTIALKDLAHKVVLLDFWGTWCGPCREATPSLVDYYKKMSKNPNFVMIGIACNEKSEDAWRAYIMTNHMNWHEFIDTSHRVGTAFGIHVFPSYIVIDGDGVVRAQQDAWRSSETMQWIDSSVNRSLKALKGTEPSFGPAISPR